MSLGTVEGGEARGPGLLGLTEQGLAVWSPGPQRGGAGISGEQFLFSSPSMGGPSTASWCSTRWTALLSPTYNVTPPPAAPMSLSPGSMALSELFPVLAGGGFGGP